MQQPNLELIQHIFQEFHQNSEIDAVIMHILTEIGLKYQVSRVYVFEDLKADNCCSNMFEWCSQGTASQKAQRQRLSYAEEEAGRGFDWFDEEGIFYCPDCTKQLSAYPKSLIEPGV